MPPTATIEPSLRCLALALALAVALVACSSFSEAKVDDDAGSPVDAGISEPFDAADADAGAAPIAFDTFTRVVATGFGSAELGGTWNGTGARSVSDGAGRLSVKPGSGASGTLGPVAEPDVDLRAVVSLNRVGEVGAGLGTGIYISLLARREAGSAYFGKLIVATGGAVSVAINAVTPGVDVSLDRASAVLGLTPSEKLGVRFQVAGAAPTRLRMKAWKAAEPEPEAWTSEATDSTPALQKAGAFGIDAYLSAGAAAAVIASVDDFVARPAR